MLIQVDYEHMEAIATSFTDYGDQVASIVDPLLDMIEVVRNGNWIADAADDFFGRMNNNVTPSLDRLIDSLYQTDQILREILRIYHEAEEDAAACVNKGDSDVPVSNPSQPSVNAPGDPNFWGQFRNQAGHNQHLVAGCTAFVASKTYVPWGPPLGNAGQWADNARAFMNAPGNEKYGMSIDTTPKVGSIYCTPSGNHVGVVVAVDGNQFTIANGDTSKDANGNWNQPWGTWKEAPNRTYTVEGDMQFIHLPWNEM